MTGQGSTWHEETLVPLTRQGNWIETYGRVALTGEPIRIEAEARSMGRWFDVYVPRIGSDESRQVALLLPDITERRATQAKLRNADRRKDEFLAMLADELRNPLAPIGTAAELLQFVRTSRAHSRSFFGETWIGLGARENVDRATSRYRMLRERWCRRWEKAHAVPSTSARAKKTR